MCATPPQSCFTLQYMQQQVQVLGPLGVVRRKSLILEWLEQAFQ